MLMNAELCMSFNKYKSEPDFCKIDLIGLADAQSAI